MKDMAGQIAKLGGEPPVDMGSLLALPGVGPYAASAFLSLHRNRRAFLMDANVVRWLCRMVGVAWDGETRRKEWINVLADRLTPARCFRDYNYAVLDFTMTVCARRPRCGECPVKRYCPSRMDRASASRGP